MRRAIAETALVAIILAVAGGLVLAGVTGTLIIRGRPTLDLNACKSNVQTSALSKQMVPLTQCYTKVVGALEFSGEQKTYQDEMAQQISRLLYECKYQFGDAPNLPYKGDWLSNPTLCSVCSVFTLPGKQASVPADIIHTWMESHNTPEGKSYMDYLLTTALNAKSALLIEKYNRNTRASSSAAAINPGLEYAVVSIGFPQRRAVQLTGVSTGGAAADSQWITVMPLPALGHACSVTFTRYP